MRAAFAHAQRSGATYQRRRPESAPGNVLRRLARALHDMKARALSAEHAAAMEDELEDLAMDLADEHDAELQQQSEEHEARVAELQSAQFMKNQLTSRDLLKMRAQA